MYVKKFAMKNILRGKEEKNFSNVFAILKFSFPKKKLFHLPQGKQIAVKSHEQMSFFQLLFRGRIFS
jgi:hypothetical protein